MDFGEESATADAVAFEVFSFQLGGNGPGGAQDCAVRCEEGGVLCKWRGVAGNWWRVRCRPEAVGERSDSLEFAALRRGGGCLRP